ncbi:MAG: DEAD/DEAH box helicase [Burkholderiales bacterium]
MSFADLGLAESLVRACADRGYTQPTPIQTQGIPAVLAGGDLLACAQTGTGKTAAFTLPLLQRLTEIPAKRAAGGRKPVRALVLTPTRELAAQVEESVRDYGRHLPLTSMTIFGGVGMQPQVQKLAGGVDILVATPGRLLDHVGQRTVDLSQVETLVLDEADRMLDMGFIRDIRRILALLPKQRQNLLFSATFSDEIRDLAEGLLHHPTSIEVARRNAPAEAVDQKVVLVDKGAKRALLSHLIKSRDWSQVLVFTRTKHGANRLADQLGKDGISALAIHGNKSQNARTRALAEFKEGRLRVLVATDIAARGLDIVDLPHVVNFELPNVPEDYVHRIGRTGRAGASGEAVALVGADEKSLLADIEKLLKRQLERIVIADFDPSQWAKDQPDVRPPLPQRNGRGDGGRRQPRQPSAGREAAGNRPPRAPQRESIGNRPARSPQREAVGNRASRQPDVEVDGNRALPPPREVDGNRLPPPRSEADGNRAPQGRARSGQSRGSASGGQPRGGQAGPSRAGDGGRGSRAGQPGQSRGGQSSGGRSGPPSSGRSGPSRQSAGASEGRRGQGGAGRSAGPRVVAGRDALPPAPVRQDEQPRSSSVESPKREGGIKGALASALGVFRRLG